MSSDCLAVGSNVIVNLNLQGLRFYQALCEILLAI